MYANLFLFLMSSTLTEAWSLTYDSSCWAAWTWWYFLAFTIFWKYLIKQKQDFCVSDQQPRNEWLCKIRILNLVKLTCREKISRQFLSFVLPSLSPCLFLLRDYTGYFKLTPGQCFCVVLISQCPLECTLIAMLKQNNQVFNLEAKLHDLAIMTLL